MSTEEQKFPVSEVVQSILEAEGLYEFAGFRNAMHHETLSGNVDLIAFAEPDEELRDLLEKTSPIFVIITFDPVSGEYKGVVEHSFSMDTMAWRANIFWSSASYGPGLKWAQSNVPASARSCYQIVCVTDPDCPLEIDWVTRKEAQTKFGMRNAWFRVKFGREDDFAVLRQRCRVHYLFKQQENLRQEHKRLIAEIGKIFDKAEQANNNPLAGILAEHERIAISLLPDIAYPRNYHGNKIKPCCKVTLEGIDVTWPEVEGWPKTTVTWEAITDEQKRRKDESRQRRKLRTA